MSFFKVIHYMYKWHDIRKLRYPSFKVEWHEYVYFMTLDEVERYVQHQAQMWNKACEVFPVDGRMVYHYAYVVLELPLGMEVNVFHLRQNPEEIKFKPGDIVEILGYPGNGYWSEDEVNLAIIVKIPPTKEEVAEMKKQYLATHSGFDICDHALCRVFGSHIDTYEVLSQSCDSIDHASTISVFPLSKPISSKRKKALQALYDNYLEKKKKVQINENYTIRSIDEEKYVTLEEFMKETEYKFRCDFNKVGKGFVGSDRVRVYHRFWGRLTPAKIKLDWDDDDAMPFVYYLDQKGRIQFGSSDERHPDLFNKMERCRFNYPHIYFKGRLWSKRKMIVFDQFSDSNKEEMYGQFREFLDIIEHYVEDIYAYKLIFPEAEGRGDVYMNTIKEVFDMCLNESSRLYMKRHSPVGGRWRSLKRQSKFISDVEGK